MSFRHHSDAQLDPQRLEELTQEIGRELFAVAKQEHAHLSVLNRWTTQVLSWCLSDPHVKSSVLRLIDVLPSLGSHRQIAEHVHEYFPTSNLRLPVALRLGSRLAGTGLLTHKAISSIVRELVEQVAGQFIAESKPERISHVLSDLAAKGLLCTMDILGEQVLSESEADRYVAECIRLLQEMYSKDAAAKMNEARSAYSPRINLSVKPSALSPRFDPISPSQTIGQALICLEPLLAHAASADALINFDMEQYELRDLTLLLVEKLLERESASLPALGVVIQAYLRDSQNITEELLSYLATHNRKLHIRLVKGAYWDYETALSKRNRWMDCVYQSKAATDAAFERLTQRLFSAYPLVTTAIASHNVRSIAHAMALAQMLGLERSQVEFQLLYGMGDAICAAILQRGYPVRIYTPIGELIPGMAYLVRRILENTANESFLRQDFFQERSIESLMAAPIISEDEANIKKPLIDGLSWPEEPFADFSKKDAQDHMLDALRKVRSGLGKHYPILVGDRELSGRSGLTARNPANKEEILGKFSLAEPSCADEAICLAAGAQLKWARTELKERIACLRSAAKLMRKRRFELAGWVLLEVGKTWREADVEIVEAIDYLEYYSQKMLELSSGKSLPQFPGERNIYRYIPRGLTAVIAPWNFPVAILTGMSAAALVAGNAIIIKPAEQSSIIAFFITRILREAGIPADVVSYLPGIGEEIGALLVRHPEIRTVMFTGSKAVGLSIIESAGRVSQGGRFIKHVICEMGGKNAIIVDADADLDAAVAGILISAFGYAGQKCSAASRLIVLESVYDRLIQRLIAALDRLRIGDPSDPGTDIGPLIDEASSRRLNDAIAHAKDVAHIAYQYPCLRLSERGYFVGPTIVTDIRSDNRLAKEELFGPLLCVFRVATFAEALKLANESDYALTGGVYSRSPAHLERASRDFDVGNLYLNRPITGALVGRQPFGGHRLSGLGTKAGGPDYLLQLLVPKTVCINTARHGMPLE